MNFSKGLTAEHAALLAYGINSHDNVAEFFLWLPSVMKDHEIYVLYKNNKTLFTVINLPEIKKDILILVEAILFDIQFNELLYISNLEQEVEVTKIKVVAPDWDEKNGEMSVTYEKYLLDNESLAAWFLAHKEPEMANRVSPSLPSVQESDIENNIHDIIRLFCKTPANIENIEKFKMALPDAWREALFVKANEMIPNLDSSNITNNDLSDKERNYLFKTIGLLALAFTDMKGTKFGSVESPNISQIKTELERFLPEDPYGLGDRVLRERIKIGISSLQDF